jgi:hypothetical protein
MCRGHFSDNNKPISREGFLHVMTANKALALVDGEVPPCS